MTASPTSVASLAKHLAQLASTPSPTAPTFSQGVITAWSSGTTPPTVSLTLSGSSVVVPGVSYVSSYTPTVGDVVQVLKQGYSLLVMGSVASVPPSPGPPAGWFQLGQQTLSGTTASVSFTSINQAYSHLVLTITGKGDDTSASSGIVPISMQINGDSSSNYNSSLMWNNIGSSTPASSSSNGSTSWSCGTLWNSFFGTSTGAGSNAIWLPWYSGTFRKKGFFNTCYSSDGGSAGQLASFGGARSTDSTAITSILVAPVAGNFLGNSEFTLYGVL
jgi:hypothetical protein